MIPFVAQFGNHLVGKFNTNHIHSRPGSSEINCLIISLILQENPKVHFLVLASIKEDRHLEQVNQSLLAQLKSTAVVIVKPVEAEADEMGRFVQSKKQEGWLWHAIDHETEQVLTYVLADHQIQALVELKALPEPPGIQTFYTDGWRAYARLLDEDQHVVSRWNTQKIERKHATLRTRIKRSARKTICFSKSEWLHDVVTRLFINRYEFGRAV